MMVSDVNAPRAKRGWKWVAGMALGGAAAGGLAGFLFADRIDAMLGGPEPDPSRLVAFMVALVYGATALLVLAGLVNPRIGARFLNVEDADELIEQRRQLVLSALSMLSIAGILLALAFAAPAGPLPREAALGAAMLGFVVLAALSARVRGMLDELMRAVSQEATVWGFHLLAVGGGVWSVAAHLGYAPAPQPLDFITAAAAALLVGAFIAVGKRGMLAPR
jgi:O-antigen/teichoic acid export membrane protein